MSCWKIFMFSFLRSDWSSRNMQGKIVVYLYWNVRIVGFYHSFGDSLKVETKITKLLRNRRQISNIQLLILSKFTRIHSKKTISFLMISWGI